MPMPMSCNCPNCISVEGCAGPLSGVAVSILNGGTVVATGKTDATGKVCLSAAAGSLTAQGSYNGITTSIPVTFKPCASGTIVGTLNFVDRITVTVRGCSGPLAGATVTIPECGSGTTGSDGTFTCNPTTDVYNDGVDISVTWQGRTQTGHVSGDSACNPTFHYIDEVCVASSDGCVAQPLPGVDVVVTVDGHVAGQGTTDSSGNICFNPVLHGIVAGDTIAVEGSYPCHVTATATSTEACATPIAISLLPDDDHCCNGGQCPPGVVFPLVVTLNDGIGDITLTAVSGEDASQPGEPPGCVWMGTAIRTAAWVAADCIPPYSGDQGYTSCYDCDVEVLWVWTGGGFVVKVAPGVVGCGNETWCGPTPPGPAPHAGSPAGFGRPNWNGTPNSMGPWTVDSCTPLHITGTVKIPAGDPACCVYGSDPSFNDGLGHCGVLQVTLTGDTCGGGGVAGSVFARGNGTDPGATGWHGYSAKLFINSDGIAVQLLAATSGGTATLGVLSATGGAGDWYRVQLGPQSTTIAVQVQRRSDSKYLQANGAWSASATSCLSVTDSGVTGSGYMGLGLTSNATQLLESDDFAIPLGPFSGAISEGWDEVAAPALPSSTGFVYHGSLVTDGAPPLAAISAPNVLEAPLGQAGYATYNSIDGSGGDVTVSAWFGIAASSYYYYQQGGGGLPSTVTVTFDASSVWGSYAGQTVTLDLDATLGDYPSPCLTTGTDGGHCDGSGTTEGLLTITLTQTSPGVVSAMGQWTGGAAGPGCADGECEYYGTASATGIVQGGPSGILTFGSMSYQAGGFGTPYVQDWDTASDPAIPSDWTALNPTLGPTTSATAPIAAETGPNVLLGTENTVAGNDVVYYSTSDTTGGNVLVQADFAAYPLVSGDAGTGTLYGRLTNPTGLQNAVGVIPYAYAASVVFAPAGEVSLVCYTESMAVSPPVAATYTLGNLTGLSLGASTWYTLSLSCDGHTIQAWLQRKSDGLWLQPDKSWASNWAACISYTVSGGLISGSGQEVTGSGYAGIGLLSGATTTIESDHFVMTPVTGGSFAPGGSSSTVTEDFDGVTAPALPTDFSDASTFFATSTTHALTGANALVGGENATWRIASFGTPDAAGGNVIVEAAVLAEAWTVDLTRSAGVYCRSTIQNTSNNGYQARLYFGASNGELVLSAIGSVTTDLKVLSGIALSAVTWYRIQLSAIGARLTVLVQRMSDSLYLQSDSSWGTTAAPCIVATDGSISRAGYAGIGVDGDGNLDSMYADSFKLTQVAGAVITLSVPT